MNSEFETVFCPIAGRSISVDSCMEICFVAEGEWPNSELPIGFDLTEDGQRICMTCKEHPDLD